MKKMFILPVLLATGVSGCVSYETAVEVAKERADMIGYDETQSVEERVARLDYIGRQADRVHQGGRTTAASAIIAGTTVLATGVIAQ